MNVNPGSWYIEVLLLHRHCSNDVDGLVYNIHVFGKNAKSSIVQNLDNSFANQLFSINNEIFTTWIVNMTYSFQFHEGIIHNNVFFLWMSSPLSTSYQNESTPGGYLVQKTLRGCATNMGSKISLLVYEWPLIKCKIWYINGSIFQNLAKFEPKLAQI